MKLGNEAYNLETVGVQEEGEFRIARSGKAFRALIDGLYADKHQSIVRELAANAFDSHQRAGREESFFIHVPVTGDVSDDRASEFYIRDYGVGMTHDTVMNLYSTMFESDKTASNDEVGMFGLGSKTPFAYTDQFYVVCYDGEKARQYVAAIGQDGVPRIMLLEAEESDEPRGVRVGFSVERQDFDAFRDAVRQIVMGYTPPFETNIDIEQYKLPTPVFSGDGWAAYSSLTRSRHTLSTWNVRQGCVIYPVEEVGGLRPPYDDRYTYLFDAPIGKVTVTTSRERVEYKPETIKFLNERIEEIKAAVKIQVWEQIKDIRPVATFFSKAGSLKPGWLNESYTHPITGLTGPSISFTGQDCFFEASEDAYNDRWAYNARQSLNLSYPHSSTVYVLKDVAPFLDPERDASVVRGFTKTEHRRLARFTRAFATANDSKAVTVAIGVHHWSQDYWECALPNLVRIPVTYEEMKAAIPKRNNQGENGEEVPIQPPIRGLGLARASGDTQPVFAVEDDVSKAAWVKSDMWKAAGKKLQAVAKMVGVGSLYVASPSAEDRCQGIPTLSQAVLDHFDKVGLSLTDAIRLNEYSYYNKLSTVINFGRYLLKGEKDSKAPTPRPDLYDKVSRVRGGLGDAYRFLRPFIESGLCEFESEAKAGLENFLFKEAAGGVKLPPVTKGFKAFEAIRKAFNTNASNGNNLALRFLDDLNYSGVQKETAPEKLVEALIALNRIVPITVNIKDKP